MVNEPPQDITALAELRAWLSTVASALDIATDQQVHRQQAMIRRTMATNCNQRNAELQWDSKLRAAEASLQSVLGMLRAWTGRQALPDMILLLIDVRVQTDLAEEALTAWRAARAELQVQQMLVEEVSEELLAKVEHQHTLYLMYLNSALTTIPQDQGPLS